MPNEKASNVDKIDQIEADSIFGSFLESFGIKKSHGVSETSQTLNKKPSKEVSGFDEMEIKPSTKVCKDVFLFIACREDSYDARSLYRKTWLNPNKWLPIKGKTNPLAEELPSIAYRFFLIENESEKISPLKINKNNVDSGSDGDKYDKIERKVVLKSQDDINDEIMIPTNGHKKYGKMSTTMVRSWSMAWTLKHTEFRFFMFLDLGKSFDIPFTPPSTWSQSLSSLTDTMFKGQNLKKKIDLNKNMNEIQKHSGGGGGGYSMVCIERIADELRYRPNERFYWGSQTCDKIDETSEPEDKSVHEKFQLFSQDVVELLTLAESKLTLTKGVSMSADALLESLKLTLLDDRLRIQDISNSENLLLHAKTAVFSAKNEYLKAQHHAGHINTSTFKEQQVQLQDWSKEQDKGMDKAPPNTKKKKAGGPEPSCRMMTMMTVSG